jgi:hypothetical protein
MHEPGVGTKLQRAGVAALIGMSCAQPRPAIPSSASSTPPVASAPRVPAEARAVYWREDGALLGLVEVGGRSVVITPELGATAEVEKIPEGYRLHPARATEPVDSPPRMPLPSALRLLAPIGDAGWQLDAGSAGLFAELRNPWARRLGAGLARVELERVDLQGFEAFAQLQHYLHLLRDQPAKELREFVSSVDPEVLKSKGGARGYVAEQLLLQVESLRQGLSNDESSDLERYVTTARAVVYEDGHLWLPGDDGFLFGLAKRRARTDDKLVIRDGALMRIDTSEGKVVGCDLGIMLPEPTENHGRPWAPFAPPAPGKLGAFTYVMFVLQTGPRGSCEQLRAPEFAYPVRHGVHYFRLFADSNARVLGAQLIGYMVSVLYALPGASEGALLSMLRANDEEQSRQAE